MICKHCHREIGPERQDGHAPDVQPFADAVACDDCIARHEAAEIASERAERMGLLVASGQLQCDIASYGTPWKSAVAANVEAWRFARECRARDGNVFIYGPEGIGKTAIARFMLWRAFVRNRSVAELPAFRLARLHYPEEVFHLYAQPYVLLLDDVSSVSWTDKSMVGFKELLEERAALRRCTIITSQFAPAALHATLTQAWPANPAMADSVLRRLRPVKEIAMSGDSLRKEINYGEWN